MNKVEISNRLSSIEIDLKNQAQRFLPHHAAHLNLQTQALSHVISLIGSTLAKDHHLYQQLVLLDAAWCQLEMGLYGLCSDCEAELSHEALRSSPLQQRCPACHTRFIAQSANSGACDTNKPYRL